MLEKLASLPLARFVLTAVGLFAVLFGMADIASRLGAASFGQNATSAIFGSFAAKDNAAPAQVASALLASSATLASTTPLVPARLKIQKIGVDATVDPVGQTAAGAMATPKNFDHVGWYSLGAQPGQEGSAVFAGHVNNALTKPGVFEHLSLVKIGDTVTISDKTNNALVYVVTEIDKYSATGAPAASIFANTGPSQLVLITCDGSWDGSAHSFDKRLVVYARLSVITPGLHP